MTFRGEVFYLEELSAGVELEGMLRRVSEEAALLECVMEAAVAKVAAPAAASGEVVEALEEFAGRFARRREEVLWRPGPPAEAWLGTGGEAAFAGKVAKEFSGWEIF